MMPVVSESCRIGQREKLNCDAVAREALVDPMVRFGAMMLVIAAPIESRAFVPQQYQSLDADSPQERGCVFFYPRASPKEDSVLFTVYTPGSWQNGCLSLERVFGQWTTKSTTAVSGNLSNELLNGPFGVINLLIVASF